MQKYLMRPSCFAHDFGRLILNEIAYGNVKPSESQQQQMCNVHDMTDLPMSIQIRILRQVSETDEVMRFILARCRYAMPDAPVEPRTVMYARLLASNIDEAMLVCAMMFALELDMNIAAKELNPNAKPCALTYADLVTHTRGNVLDHAMAQRLVAAQIAQIAVDGLEDANRLNHLHSYRGVIEA